MNILVLVAVLAVSASTQAADVSINDIVDQKLQLANKLSIANNRSVTEYGSGFLYSITYENGVGIGLDSLKRTGDCLMKFNGEKITYVYNIGQNILATFFRKVTYKDVTGSGYYKVLDNSIQYSYTVSYEGGSCEVRLESLDLTIGSVAVYIQDKSWDTRTDPEFDAFVQQQILPAMTHKLKSKSSTIENSLENVFCHTSQHVEEYTAAIDILRTFLFD